MHFADGWVWVGLGAWAIVGVGLVRRIGLRSADDGPSLRDAVALAQPNCTA